MKILILLALICIATVTAKLPIETEHLEQNSPLKMLMNGVLNGGNNNELSTYIKLFDQVFPMLKAITDSVDPSKGQSVQSFNYEWCLRDDTGNRIACLEATWIFIVGFTSSQYHDDKRFYNLTVTPYANMSVDLSVSSFTGPAKLSIGPYIDLISFRSPVSFEMENRNRLCYSGGLDVKPISVLTAAQAQFLECEMTIPEDTHRCNWDEGVGAKVHEAVLNEGYQSVLLQRTCVESG